MLSDRISKLFTLLQCSNTDIARFAGCSPSNISRLKSGSREPPPESRSVALLAKGIYGYADYENMLSVLCELCETEDRRAEVLRPAIIAWLYDTREFEPPRAVVPKSKRTQGLRRQSFGEKLDRAMTLLELSNAQLAAPLNIDASLVSRYRNGTHSPYGNERIMGRLSNSLFARAQKQGRAEALAELCAVPPGELDADAVLDWLCDTEEDNEPSALAKMLLRSIGAFTPGQGLPAAEPAIPPVQVSSRYWGTGGLRSAVVRFLTEAARSGGELLLYSDEPMDWMSGDPAFFAVWARLMVACVKNGVKIKIIHNIDRDAREMVDAINGWLPLYISGMIEPYVFRKTRNARFYHTMFLRPGGACILGFFPTEAGENRWYDYIAGGDARLDAVQAGYASMISCAAPFLRTYPAAQGDAFRQFCEGQPGKKAYMLSGLSVVTMPESLLGRMLSRAALDARQEAEVLTFYRKLRCQFFDTLDRGSVDELVLLPDRDALMSGGVRVNFATELVELPLYYTPEEYAEHIAAVVKLIASERHYHLTLLPFAPFRDIQMFTTKDAVAVLRCREPHTAFVFTNPMLTQSVSDYFAALREQYASDRFTTVQTLEALYKALASPHQPIIKTFRNLP